MSKELPYAIERIDDGELLLLNEDNKTYSFRGSEMGTPFRYVYEVLMESDKCKGKFRVLDIDKVKQSINLEGMVDICAGPMSVEQIQREVGHYMQRNPDRMIVDIKQRENDCYVSIYIPTKDFEKKW